jgi:hypothetical protein
LIDLKLADMARIQVAPVGSSAYAIRRSGLGTDFALEAVPPGRKAAEPNVITPSPTTFGSLEASDVTTASAIDFAKASTAVITLTDGRSYGLAGVTIADKHWLKLTSDKDALLMAKATGRAFEVPGYRFDALFRPLEALLIPKPAPAAKHSTPPKT